MPDSSETGEAGGKSSTGRGRAHTSRESRSSRLSRAVRQFATNRHEQCGLDSVSFRFPSWQSLDGHPVPPANCAPGHTTPASKSSANKNRKETGRLQACLLNALPRSAGCDSSDCPGNLAASSHHQQECFGPSVSPRQWIMSLFFLPVCRKSSGPLMVGPSQPRRHRCAPSR